MGLCFFFLPNISGATFIQGATFIPDSRVGESFIRLNELGGCQINSIDVNFHLQKVWKFLIQIQLTKSKPKITRGVKVPCLMPIRVKSSRIKNTKAFYYST